MTVISAIVKFAICYLIARGIFHFFRENSKNLYMVCSYILILGVLFLLYGTMNYSNTGNGWALVVSGYLITTPLIALAIAALAYSNDKRRTKFILAAIASGICVCFLGVWTYFAHDSSYQYDNGLTKSYLQFVDKQKLTLYCAVKPGHPGCFDLARYKPNKKKQIYTRGCEADSYFSDSYCIELAELEASEGDYEAAYERVSHECQKEPISSRACDIQAQMMQEGHIKEFPSKEIVAVYERGCNPELDDGSVSETCEAAVNFAIREIEAGGENHVAETAGFVKRFYIKYNIRGDKSMVRFARMLHDYSGDLELVREARSFLEPYCQNEDDKYNVDVAGAACEQIGAFYEHSVPAGKLQTGSPPPVDIDKARFYYEKACSSDTKNCADLGRMYVNGLGVEKDSDFGFGLLAQSCNRQNPDACRLMKEVVEQPNTPFPDLKDCIPFYHASSCRNDESQNCESDEAALNIVTNYDTVEKCLNKFVSD